MSTIPALPLYVRGGAPGRPTRTRLRPAPTVPVDYAFGGALYCSANELPVLVVRGWWVEFTWALLGAWPIGTAFDASSGRSATWGTAVLF